LPALQLLLAGNVSFVWLYRGL